MGRWSSSCRWKASSRYEALFFLPLLGLALAQIARPVEEFQKALGPLPPGARVEVEAKGGRLLAARYQGPENASFLARFADRALALRLGLRGTPTVFAGPYWVPDPFDLARVLDYLELAR